MSRESIKQHAALLVDVHGKARALKICDEKAADTAFMVQLTPTSTPAYWRAVRAVVAKTERNPEYSDAND